VAESPISMEQRIAEEEKVMLNSILRRGALLALIALAALVFGVCPVSAQDQISELKELKKEVEALRGELHRTLAEKTNEVREA
jgi:hypothetical protein